MSGITARVLCYPRPVISGRVLCNYTQYSVRTAKSGFCETAEYFFVAGPATDTSLGSGRQLWLRRLTTFLVNDPLWKLPSSVPRLFVPIFPLEAYPVRKCGGADRVQSLIMESGMMFFKILWSRIWCGKARNGLLLALITAITTLYVFVDNSAKFSDRSMKLIMKRMGHNMLILPESSNPLDVYNCTDHQREFSDTVTHFLAGKTSLLSKYYVGRLQRKVELNGHSLILTGIEPVARPDETREKGNLVKPVAKGTVRLGALAAELLAAKSGDSLKVMSGMFKVDRIMPQKGTEDDFRLYIPLPEAQSILGKAGLINGIVAFECLHIGSLAKSEAFQKAELAKVMPGFRHISKMDIAKGRYLGRLTTSSFLGSLLIVLVIVAILAIVIAGLQEVTESRFEVSIMAAMGADYSYVVGLFLAKVLLIAGTGTFLGFVIGGNVSVQLTSEALVFNTQPVDVQWNKLPWVMVWAIGIASIAELLPLLKLARLDPGSTLMEE